MKINQAFCALQRCIVLVEAIGRYQVAVYRYQGISTGCTVAAALKLAGRHPGLASIVTMANDTGQRYFTTALCGEDKKVDVPEREHPMDPKTQRDLDRYQSAWEILT